MAAQFLEREYMKDLGLSSAKCPNKLILKSAFNAKMFHGDIQ
jgi:hypothetical protein